MQFKDYLIERINNSHNEADIVLHQVMNNVDESHVDYGDDRLDFNIGIMIKRSAYSRLYLTIIKSKTNSVKLAKNMQKDGYSIVVNSTSYPKRMQIDDFIGKKAIYNLIKNELIIFIENYKSDKNEFNTSYETNKEINTDEHFEKLYNTVIAEMKKRISEYKDIAADIQKQIEETANEEKRQILVRSLEKLKDEYFGDTFKKFKKIAAEAIDVDMTRFEKEYKKKFDTRLEDFYQYVIKL